MLASASPADVLLQPIFNPVGGYASYIVPAAFVLILQQMLLIGASLLTVVALAQPINGAFASVLGRGVAHLTIYLPALALYFIVLPRFYGFSTLGPPLQRPTNRWRTGLRVGRAARRGYPLRLVRPDRRRH